MTNDTVMDATGLTQWSSREQLSALMDGALPADETRFLLRRLQHDASLAGCWERWRLAAEVMRGLAPAQRLPADFAARVAASLRVEEAVGSPATFSPRPPAWMRWGGGAAVAASLAVAAVMIRSAAPGAEPAIAATAPALAADHALPVQARAPVADAPGTASGTAALATALVAAARPLRPARREARQHADAAPSAIPAGPAASTQDVAVMAGSERMPVGLPQADAAPRPWPRSVLPQYADGGLSVGFGDLGRTPLLYNPFQPGTGLVNQAPALATAPADPPASAAGDGQGPVDGKSAFRPDPVRPDSDAPP